MEDKDIIIQAELKRLRILYASMLFGCIAFLAITFYLINRTGGFLKNNIELGQIFWFISIFLLGLLPLSYYLFKRKVNKLTLEHEFYEKLVIYRGAYFIKITLIEMACFLSTAIFLLTSNRNILYQILMILVVMVMSFPYKVQMIKDLKLKDGEIESFE